MQHLLLMEAVQVMCRHPIQHPTGSIALPATDTPPTGTTTDHCRQYNPPEESFLSTKNLHGAGRLLGQIDQTAGVGNEPRPDQLPDQHCEVRGDRRHTALEVVKQLAAVLTQLNHLQRQQWEQQQQQQQQQGSFVNRLLGACLGGWAARDVRQHNVSRRLEALLGPTAAALCHNNRACQPPQENNKPDLPVP
jgi:hypothetical protein